MLVGNGRIIHRPAIKNNSSAIMSGGPGRWPLRFFEIAFVLVRLDNVARFIVNADDCRV
jgi:hypothetical protein